MCGVCAGRPGWTELGDVIVADRVYRYDVGEICEATGARHVRPDVTTYQIPADWKQPAERLVVRPDAGWLALRPRTQEAQQRWILAEIHARRDPLKAPDRNVCCADWDSVLESLWANGQLKTGTLEMTAEGHETIARLQLLYPDGLPEPGVPEVHVGAIGTGSALQKSDRIWETLADDKRLVRGLDMEGAVIGFVGWAHDVRSVVVKGVMDFAECERTHRFKPFAARAAAEVLLELLRTQLDPQRAHRLIFEPRLPASQPAARPPQPYPALEAYRHPDTYAGRDRELSKCLSWVE
jgi:nucleoside phosphorylase